MRAQYTKKPIGSLDILARALDVELSILIGTANSVERHYHPHQIPKKNGGSRMIHIPTQHLKTIQKRINRRIFDNVLYPSYLFGGVREKDYVKNAAEHSGCNALIAMDVKDFYPSITIDVVKKIFQYFFRFPRDVAEILAKLCCLNGQVPQGACTSSHVANLALHDSEYHFVQYCKNKGWTYTRLLDDIAVSSKAKFQPRELEGIIAKIKAMLSRSGLRINNKKTRILSRANPVDLMEVTGLWLNRGKPRAHRADRNAIRKQVYECEMFAKEGREKNEFHEMHNHVSGRVSKLAYLQHVNAQSYRDRLRAILPLFDINQATNILRQAQYMARTTAKNRESIAYCKRYYVLQHRLNILMRTDRALAGTVRNILASCKPILRPGSIYHE
ncbi:reverse transcriptase family protein [Achromobacter kerstersii]